MKMENVSVHGLLEAYMKANYPGKCALVIFQEDKCDSPEEYQTLMAELDEMGYLPPQMYRSYFGFLIIEMQDFVAQGIINKHNKGFVRMELFENGVCVHENR